MQGIFYKIFNTILKDWPKIVIFHLFLIKKLKFPPASGGHRPRNALLLQNSDLSVNLREKFERFFQKFCKLNWLPLVCMQVYEKY